MVIFRQGLLLALVVLLGVLRASGGPYSVPASPAVTNDEPAGLLDDYAVTRWQAEDGLPADSVCGLAFSEDGFLWCLTEKSLSRFDGVRFDVVPWRAAFSEVTWESMSLVGGHTIWLYGPSGAYGFGPGGMGTSPWPATAPSGQVVVRRVIKDANRGHWVVASNGVAHVEGPTAQWYGVPGMAGGQGLEIRCAEEGREGRIWLGAGASVLGFDRGKFTVETTLDAPVDYLSLARDGTLWCATATRLSCKRGGRWEAIPPPPHRSHPRWRITALKAFDGEGVWVGTTGGLCRWREGVWTLLTPRDGFYPLEILSIARDADGNIWAGSSGGLLRLKRRVLQVCDSGLVLLRHSFTAVLPDPAVGLRVGVAGGSLLEGHPGAFRPTSQIIPVSRTAVISALLKSRDGALWIGTQGDYLWRCQGGKSDCIAEPSREENSAVNINALLEDRQGRIWAGTGNGVMIYNPAKRQLEPLPGDTLSVRVHVLLEDRDGAVWAGLRGEGVARILPDGSVTRFGGGDGLSAKSVLALCQDSEGVIWAGTTEGLGRWDGKSWRTLTERQGLPEGPLAQLLEDGPNLWAGSRDGVLRLSRQELTEVIAGERATLAPQLFGLNEGLRDEQCSSGFGNLAARDAVGRLWFSTVDGLVMIDPKRVVEKSPGGRRATIEEVRAGDVVLRSMQDGLTHESFAVSIPPGAGRLSIRYSAPVFSVPERLQFKRMLEGYDAQWSMPTGMRTISYPRLPPGKYRFRLMAGTGGTWKESPQTVDIEIRPFFWQRGWFRVLAGIGAIGLVVLTVKRLEIRRNRRRFMELERQQSLERERSRIAHDLHDDLGASLTEIGLLSAVAQRPTVAPERARHHLGEIAEKVRKMVETLDEIVWAINPRNDTVTSLGDYLCEYAQRILQLTTIRCRLDLAPQLPSHPLDPDRRHTLFLAFNEALNNVIRHSGAREVSVRIAIEAERLVVSVRDDGCGFTVESSGARGEGIKSMRNRLAGLGGECAVFSQPGQGTTVTFSVPLE